MLDKALNDMLHLASQSSIIKVASWQGGLTASGLIEVNIDALQLQVGVTVIGAGGVDTVLVGDNLRRQPVFE